MPFLICKIALIIYNGAVSVNIYVYLIKLTCVLSGECPCDIICILRIPKWMAAMWWIVPKCKSIIFREREGYLMKTDILIIGSGCSGLYCALHLPKEMQVTVITKSDLESSD